MSSTPLVDFRFRLLSSYSVLLLQLSGELVALAGYCVQVVIGQFTPAFLGRAFQLLPFAFNLVPVHAALLLFFFKTIQQQQISIECKRLRSISKAKILIVDVSTIP